MSSPSGSIAALRQLLAERHPQAAPAVGGAWETGLPRLDALTGGLPRGAVTEVVCAAPSCGGQLLLGALFAAARRSRGRVALVDADDAFDPCSWPADSLRHLVWVRADGAATALRVADLVVRDANFLLVALDLRDTAPAELRKIPATSWYRLQRSAEANGLMLVVLTPRPSVASARLRLQLERSHTLSDLTAARPERAQALAPVVQRRTAWLAAG